MRMRIVIGSLIAALAVGSLLVFLGDKGHSGNASTAAIAPRSHLVAAFYPIAFAAEQLDPSAQVENLTPPGAEPHDLEVTPQDVRDLQSANLVLLLGRGFQPQLESAAGGSTGVVVKLLDTPGLDVRPGDPHVWLDPHRYALIVAEIARHLGPRADANAKRLIAGLNRLDAEYRSGLADCQRHEIVTSHEAFGYLAPRYGLEQVAVSGISPEAEPTPGALQDAVDAVRRTGATTVFTEPLVSPKLAETVARETGAKTAVLNPIEGLTPDQESRGEDYFSLMRENLATLREALGCR
jgi:zinc transport system substrate-binding protein